MRLLMLHALFIFQYTILSTLPQPSQQLLQFSQLSAQIWDDLLKKSLSHLASARIFMNL